MASEVINIKGTRKGLVICVDSTRDFEELKASLRSKIESGGSFFKGAKFTFHLDKTPLSAAETRELQDICCQHGLVPDEQIDWQPKTARPVVTRLPRPIIRPEAAKDTVNSLPSAGISEKELNEPGMLIQRGIRSGQKINHRGNVIVLGDVNAGSEITATGDIIVFGALRGIAHAGAAGNESAQIMACRLQPTQLRIAGKICRPPDKDSGGNGPEVARLVEGQMMIESYVTNSMKN